MSHLMFASAGVDPSAASCELPINGEAAPFGAFLVDADGRIGTWDAGAERLTGRAAGDAVGRHVTAIFPSADPASAALSGLYQRGDWHAHPTGTGGGRAWATLSLSALPREQGGGFAAVVRSACADPVAHDATAPGPADDARLRLLTQAMTDAVEGLAQLGPDGRYVTVNAAYAAPLGRTPAELTGQRWETTVHPADLPVVRRAFDQMVATGKGEAEVRGLNRAGGVFHARVAMVAIRDAGGAVAGSFCFMKDLTDRRRSAEQLRQSQELLASVLDSSLDGVIACRAVRDADTGRVVDFEFQLVNATAERMLGHPATVMVGRRMLDLFPGNVETGLFDKYAAVVNTGMPFDGERHYGLDGLSVWLNIVAVRLGTDGLAITFADVSAAKRAAAELAAAQQLDVARRAAEAASAAKGNFLANMSHEIRTPIAAIIGYADLLLDPARPEAARLNDLQSIRRNGRHLLGVVNDVLDASKIEAGGMTVERIEADLPRLAAEAASITRPAAIEHGLTLHVRFATPVPRVGLTDPLRLRQILINLLGNAIKFTRPGGTVTLAVGCDGPADADAVVRFEVTDTGVGMTAAQTGRLFQPFAQADASTTRQFGGTGLGLTISRRLARLLGGDVTVRSDPGRGSTFTLTVAVGPVRADQMVDGLSEAAAADDPPDVEDGAPPAGGLAGVTVLLAEDGVDNREILTAYLRGAGADVQTVEDGRRAVDVASAAADAGRPFAVVLMDMQMPVLDGYAAASELRRLGYARPVLALTAHAMADDRAKCLAAGCDDYLTKPIDRQTLIAAVARYARRAVAAVAAVAAAAPHPEEPPMSTSPVLRSTLADDPRLSAVVAGFVGRLPAAVAELESLAQAGPTPDLARAAHRLKGAGGSYGLPQISEAAAALEGRIHAGNAGTVEAEVAALVGILRRVEGYSAAA